MDDDEPQPPRCRSWPLAFEVLPFIMPQSMIHQSQSKFRTQGLYKVTDPRCSVVLDDQGLPYVPCDCGAIR